VARPHGDIDPATIRISFLMGVIRLLNGDVASVDMIAKFVETGGVSHHQIVELI
jgi:hypothetical protein